MKEKLHLGEILALLALTGTGIAYYMETYTYKISRFERTGGPAVYPRLILACLFFFIALRIVQIILDPKSRKKFVFFNLFAGNKGVFFFTFVLYILLMPYAGYILATAVYLFVACCQLARLKEGSLESMSRLALRALFFLLATIGIYVFFAKILNVAVPQGFFEKFI